MNIKHKALEVTAVFDTDFTQSQYERYQELLIEKSKELRSASAFDRILIEAAQEAGILSDIKANLNKPPVVKWLSLKVHAAITEAVTVPPE